MKSCTSQMSASNPSLFTGKIMRLVFTLLSEKWRWQSQKGISDGHLRCCSGLCSQMKGLLWWLSSKTSACNAEVHLQCRRHGFDPWVRKIPGRRKWQPTPVFLPGKSHGQRSYSPRGCKESDMISQSSAAPLNKTRPPCPKIFEWPHSLGVRLAIFCSSNFLNKGLALGWLKVSFWKPENDMT